MTIDSTTQTERLLAWYDRERRVLPWREDPSPYHVWLSEIMLQQTRVEAVKGYYARFLDALPDIASLAAAEEDVYLKLWEGLGYYSRVRNLHKAAVQVMEEYGGEMPRSAEELIKLAGIGPYTAAAIASIAFGEPAPAVDGNLLRVFARMTAYGEDSRSEAAKRAAGEYFLPMMVVERPGRNVPGDLNQALMDLGATVCVPNGAPLCGECPWSEWCEAHARGEELSYPVIPAKKSRSVQELTVFLIRDDERIALRKRPARGLLAGLYEYPNAEGHLDAVEAEKFVRQLGFAPIRIRSLPPAKHIFTHKEWHMIGYEVRADELTPPPSGGGILLAQVSEIRDVYSVPSAFAAFTERVLVGE